jgi:hypothetical protein
MDSEFVLGKFVTPSQNVDELATRRQRAQWMWRRRYPRHCIRSSSRFKNSAIRPWVDNIFRKIQKGSQLLMLCASSLNCLSHLHPLDLFQAQLKNKEDKMRHRQRCGCNAAADQFSLSENHLDQHHLFANCTSCGLIICAKEGEGVCFYCNAYVTACGTNFDDADGEHVNTGLQLANDHKDKLLSFASSSAKRTR